MAKKRKDSEEEEDKPFKLPKFNEKEFVKKEKNKIRSTFLAFLFGLLVALISFGFWVLLKENAGMRWPLVLIFAIFTGSWLKYIFEKLKVKISDFGKKEWAGAYLIYFFTWLVTLIVLVNPPIYDEEPPMVDNITLPDMQEPGGIVMILAKITDNTGVEKSDITLEIIDPNGAKASQDFTYKNNILRYNHTGPSNIDKDQKYDYRIIVEDKSGLKTTKEGSFTYSNDTISLLFPDSGESVDLGQDIKFRVKTDITRFFYTVDNGKDINVTGDQIRDDEYYSGIEYEGWPAVTNKSFTINVSAEVVHYFKNSREKFQNYIHDSTTYNLSIEEDEDISDIGDDETGDVKYPKAKIERAPGFEALVFLVSLLIVFLIFRKYRKK